MQEFLRENLLMFGLLFVALFFTAIWASKSVIMDGHRAGKTIAIIIGVVTTLGLVGYILSENTFTR